MNVASEENTVPNLVTRERHYSLPEEQIMEQRTESHCHCIIVIDHEEDVRQVLRDQLEGLGFKVFGENNGVSALARIAYEKRKTIALGVIVELELPVLGGMAILQELRDRHPDVPVMVMAHPEGITRLRQAIRLGAKEYLVKPFDSELFRRKCLEVFQTGQCTT